jgi:hypothetical protein
MLRFHVDSTKRGAKNLCERGQLSGLRQFALGHLDLRCHSFRAELVRPQGRDVHSVANGITLDVIVIGRGYT